MPHREVRAVHGVGHQRVVLHELQDHVVLAPHTPDPANCGRPSTLNASFVVCVVPHATVNGAWGDVAPTTLATPSRAYVRMGGSLHCPATSEVVLTSTRMSTIDDTTPPPGASTDTTTGTANAHISRSRPAVCLARAARHSSYTARFSNAITPEASSMTSAPGSTKLSEVSGASANLSDAP
ncbi:hypothetical protein T484DRAFT_2655642 [Baffinella frigidus]|nr:hypothetical protein T484DRAFT_2655642 [Cryptophyta sp. CCMP2293]